MSIQVRSNEKPQTPPASQVPAPAAEISAPVEGSGESEEQSSTSSAPEAEKPSEQNNASESDPEGEKKPETNEESELEEKESGKKKGGFQRRIDKLSAKITAKDQELEYWKQQALKGAGAPKMEPEVKPLVQSLTSDGKPKPENFETHAEYVEALTDWKTEQKLRERDQRAAKERFDEAQSKIVTSYSERAKAFSTKTPDFQEVIEEVNHIPLSPTLQDIILNSENGPELAYELAKNPGEFERISKLPPTVCAREVGRFEVKLNSSKRSGTEKKITQAPTPIAPVGTGGKGSVAKSIYDQGLSQTEYEALRREQLKKRRQAG
jgi:hypothetical protein